MKIGKCEMHTNRSGQEITMHGSVEFPIEGYWEFYDGKDCDNIPWHWHDELEIIYIQKGGLELQVPNHTYTIHENEMVLIGSSIPHFGKPIQECELKSFVFSQKLISGDDSTIYYKKYIQPFVQCLCVTYSSMHALFLEAFHAFDKEEFGYEFIVRQNLSNILLDTYKNLDVQQSTQRLSTEAQRTKDMQIYIHTHYQDSINLKDIANVVSISERECLRSFQNTLQISPMQYVQRYRITKASESLLDHPNESISQIALACGFDSASSFSKYFKRYFNCTPKEYRQKKISEE